MSSTVVVTIRDEYIYALVDPDENEVRYIGRTKNPEQRYRAHLNPPVKASTYEWMLDLRLDGKQPRMVILEKVSGLVGCQREAEVIAEHRKRLGDKLLNRSGYPKTDGHIVNPDGSPFEQPKAS